VFYSNLVSVCMVTEILPVVNHDGGDDGGNSNY